MRCKNFNFKKNCEARIANNYLTHGIHTYTAKFIPQIPRFFIEKYSKRGDTVLDPFAGSGTTLLESFILGRNSLGIDINPLAILISRVKTTPINPKKLKNSIKDLFKLLDKKIKITYNVDFPNKDYWFNESSIKDLNKIMSAIDFLSKNHKVNKKTKEFFLICFSSIIRKSSYADPSNPKVYCSPRMKEKKKNDYKFHPIELFKERVTRYCKDMEDLFYKTKNNNVKVDFVKTNDTRDIVLPKGFRKVDLIITSPPYANAQEYFRNFKLELFWLGMVDHRELTELDKNQIGGENHASLNYSKLHQTGYKEIDSIIKKLFQNNKKSAYIVYKYFYNMEKSIKEYHKVLKKGGHCVIIVGNNTVRGVKIPIAKTLIGIAKKNGFKMHDYGYDLIRNRKFMTKRNNSAEIIKRDLVIDLTKI